MSPTPPGWPAASRDSSRGRLHELGDLGRIPADTDAGGLERLGFRGGGSLRTGDDRARVAHTLAWWRLEPGDVPDDGLRDVFRDIRGGALLVVPSDLADHHDQVRLGIGLERSEGFSGPD